MNLIILGIGVVSEVCVIYFFKTISKRNTSEMINHKISNESEKYFVFRIFLWKIRSYKTRMKVNNNKTKYIYKRVPEFKVKNKEEWI